MYRFNSAYNSFDKGQLNIYIDTAVNPELNTEIFIDANLKHYPLRDYKGMLSEMTNVVKDYDKLGKRNNKKNDKHLNKHAMHLIRLFMMAIDILEKGEINTYRENEHNMLMDIRNGKYQNSDHTFNSAFYDILSEYEKSFQYAANNTSLPDEPDVNNVQEYVMSVNERVIRNEI